MYSCTEHVPFSPLCEDMFPAEKHSDVCSTSCSCLSEDQPPSPEQSVTTVLGPLRGTRKTPLVTNQHRAPTTQSPGGWGREHPLLSRADLAALSLHFCVHFDLISASLLSTVLKSPGTS